MLGILLNRARLLKDFVYDGLTAVSTYSFTWETTSAMENDLSYLTCPYREWRSISKRSFGRRLGAEKEVLFLQVDLSVRVV